MSAQTQQTMKVIEIQGFGGPEVLRPAQRPLPVPAPGEVLIKAHAAGVNRPDIIQRLGKYPPPPGVTDIPGLDIAGIRMDTGEAVCALLAGGGYAEYAAVPETLCLPIPEGLDMIAAAALPEALFTVWNNLFVRGQLKAGETTLIHGGASGIGTTAIQMARAWGATVITTAGSDEKCTACEKLGADMAINYKTDDFVGAIQKRFGENSVNVVLDMVGGAYVPRNLEVMALDGRHVSIAHLDGHKTEINIRTIMQKRLVLTGSTLRPRPLEEKAALAQGLRKHIWPLIESGKIKPVIYKTFDLDDAANAHRALESGDHIGKIVLKVA